MFKNNHRIYAALKEAYPEDADALVSLCYHGLEEPLGINHPLILQKLIGIELSQDDLQKIETGYVMISAYYFLLDSVVDEHLSNKLNSLYLTHLLVLACQKFNEVLHSHPHADVEDFNKAFQKLIAENANAIRLENEFSKNYFFYSEELEYESIVGRSNSSIILLELISRIAGIENIENHKKILRDFAFYVQLGDDLADWRDDIKIKNYTSFLRELFSKSNRVLSEQELEEKIYLSAVFESQALKVITGLNGIVTQLTNEYKSGGDYLKQLISSQCENVKSILTDIIEIKLNARA